MKPSSKDFVLASGSPQRIRLLEQIGYKPREIKPADIDENTLPHEKPLPYVKRMALEKAKAVAALLPGQNVLAADTIVTVGLRVLHKSQTPEEQMQVMRLLSGRNHKVITSVCLVDKTGKICQKTVSTRIAMKHLTEGEMKEYVDSQEWVGVCGYKIEGLLAGYVMKMTGSFTGVVGLPLYETRNLLIGAGIK